MRLLGDDLELLKSSTSEIVQKVDAIPGTTDIDENLDYGAEERIIRLTPFWQISAYRQLSSQQVRAALMAVWLNVSRAVMKK